MAIVAMSLLPVSASGPGPAVVPSDFGLDTVNMTRPGLVYSTFIDGSDEERVFGIELDNHENVYIFGATLSNDLNTTKGALQENYTSLSSPDWDGYLARVSSDGSDLLACTYIGGSGGDIVSDVVVLPNDDVLILGYTNTTDLATTPGAYQSTYQGGLRDAFVGVASADLTTWRYLTYFGGTGHDGRIKGTVGDNGSVIIVGRTNSDDLPTTPGAYMTTRASSDGLYDIFAAGLTEELDGLGFCTYLGGSGDESLEGCHLDGSGNLYVIGATFSNDLVMPMGALDRTLDGPQDGVVFHIDTEDGALLTASYLGGDGGDYITGIDVDGNGMVYLTGGTRSVDFPITPNAYRDDADFYPSSSAADAFITVLDRNLTQVDYGTFIGGSSRDRGASITVDEDGSFVDMVCFTNSTGVLCTPGCYNDELSDRIQDAYDLLIYRFDTSGWTPTYITYLGGMSKEEATNPLTIMERAPDGQILIGLETNSKDFPSTSHAYCRTLDGGYLTPALVRLNPVAVPSPAPMDVEVSEGDGRVDLAWDLSEYDNVQVISVEVKRATSPEGPNQTLDPIYPPSTGLADGPGLTNGVTYYYWVRVRTTSGWSHHTGPMAATPMGVPVSGLELTVEVQNGTVAMNWSGTVDWRGGHDNRFILNRTREGFEEETIGNLSSDATGFLDEEVPVLGKNYTYKIVPFNGRHHGNETQVTLMVYGLPSPPVINWTLAYDHNVSLRWQEPVSNGGLPLLGYRLFYRQSDTQWKPMATIPIDMDRFYNKDDLDNNVSYQFKVLAYHAYANGTPSISKYLVPYGVPSVPNHARIYIDGDVVMLVWQPPLVENGRPVTEYRIYIGEYWESIDRNSSYKTTQNTQWVHSGLRLDVPYYYRISAVNEAGEGDWTNWRLHARVVLPPTKPLNLTFGKTEDISVLLEWDPPASSGGPKTLYYHVYRRVGTGQFTMVANITNETEFRDGLVVGNTTYSYYIVSVNRLFEGEASDTTTTLFVGPPTEVRNLRAEQVGGYVMLTWDEPEDTSGEVVNLYRVTRWDELLDDTSYTVNTMFYKDEDPLVPGERYIYRVQARNDEDWGEYCDGVDITVAWTMGPATSVKVDEMGDQLWVSWDPPVVQFYCEVAGYYLVRWDSKNDTKVVMESGTQTLFKDTEVIRGRTYFYQVVAYDIINEVKTEGNSSEIKEYHYEKVPAVPWIPTALILLSVLLIVFLSVIYYVKVRQRETPETRKEEIEAPPAEVAKTKGPVPPWEAKGEVAAKTGATPAPIIEPEGILPYMVEEVMVVHQDGSLITSCAREERGTPDADLMSGMLIAVQDRIQDGIAVGGKVKSMEFGENLISVVAGAHVALAAVVYGRPDDQFNEDLERVLREIEDTYTAALGDWTGDMAAFDGLDEMIAPLIERTAPLTREVLGDVSADHGLALLSAVDFHRGYVRLKMAVDNATDETIINTAIEVRYDGDMLRLERVEPDTLKIRGDRISLDNILPGERKTVAVLFDPQICQSTHLDGHLSYFTSKGELRYMDMKRRSAEVVCPVFTTAQNANTAMLRELMRDKLHHNDMRVYRYPITIPPRDVLSMAKQALASEEIQLVREYVEQRPSFEAEVWYYAETKVKGYQFVIRLGVIREKGVVELFAASSAMEPVTGFLADFPRELNRILEQTLDNGLELEVERDEGIRRDLETRRLHIDEGEEMTS